MKAYFKTPLYKRLRRRFDLRVKAACKKLEPRKEFQAACWNYLYKRDHRKLLREYKKKGGR